MRERVYIAHPGGTIGINRRRNGYSPQRGYLQQQMVVQTRRGHRSIPEDPGREDVAEAVAQTFDTTAEAIRTSRGTLSVRSGDSMER